MYLNRIPAGGINTPTHEPRNIERKEKGTNLNNAVVLEKDQQQKQKRDQGFPRQKPSNEIPFEIYNSDADAEVIRDTPSALDITA